MKPHLPIVIAAAILVPLGAQALPDAAHDKACAAALTEAQTLQGDMGIWRAKARVIAAHRNDKRTAVGADLTEMSKEQRKEEIVLDKRLSDADSNQFALHKDGGCPQDAETRAALAEATRFKNMLDQPSRTPLPEGYCRNSPDLSAPLVLCPKKPSP